MPSYKLTYFDVRARAECIRLILTYADVEFEDVRIDFKDWPAIKPTTPFGQLPMLEIDGKIYCQSLPICRHLAKKYGLAGESDIEELVVEMIAATTEDVYWTIQHAYEKVEVDEQKGAEMHKINKETTLPTMLGQLCDMMGDSGFCVASGITWADFRVYELAFTIEKSNFCDDILTKFPKLSKLKDKVEAIPKIKKHLDNRQQIIYKNMHL